MFKTAVIKAYEEAQQIFWSRNANYGTDNIAATGLDGVLARLEDKLGRARTMLRNGGDDHQESVADTALDISNYGIILLLLLRDKWPSLGTKLDRLLVLLSGSANIAAPQLHGDVGYDLRAKERTIIRRDQICYVKTGVRIKCPEGVWCRVAGRSSMARKRGILVNEGVIDTGYTGELEVGCVLFGQAQETIEEGERIGQLIFFRAVTPPIEIVEELPVTDRSDNGWGSTGRK